jgi:hypothetical protein
MNVLSRILKDLAQEFKIPYLIEKKLFWRLFLAKREKNKKNR